MEWMASMALKRTAGAKPKMKRKAYEKALHKVHIELCHLQDWVKQTGARIIILFEGRDAAGKGGTIKAITERVSPRVFRVVALPAPSDREKTQMFMQRYIQQFPAAGEIVIFDRSWYHRAGAEGEKFRSGNVLTRRQERGRECMRFEPDGSADTSAH
jgi:polyphosphate kinase 2 (PPK2 family)